MKFDSVAEKFALPASIIVVAIAIFLSVSNSNSNSKVIATTGNSELRVPPDMVMISVSVESQAMTVEESQKENSRISNLVMATLEGIVPKNEIQTTQFLIYPVTEYNPETGETRQKGYKTAHVILVKTGQTKDVGKIIDSVVEAGASRIDQVSFYLSEEKERKVKSDILSSAASDARLKAELLAHGAGTRITGVRSVAESSFFVKPFNSISNSVSPVAFAKDILNDPTKVAEGEIEVSASVTASFDIV
jgi:uncharacterized protein YggE